MARYWLSGTRPMKTRLSVPRLMPLITARTSTSFSPRGGSAVSRNSLRPGAVTQKARARSVMKDALIEHVVAEPHLPHARPQPLIRHGDFRQREARPARAEDDRGDRELEAIERTRTQEARDGDAAPFDEKEVAATRRERFTDGAGRDAAIAVRQADYLRLSHALP